MNFKSLSVFSSIVIWLICKCWFLFLIFCFNSLRRTENVCRWVHPGLQWKNVRPAVSWSADRQRPSCQLPRCNPEVSRTRRWTRRSRRGRYPPPAQNRFLQINQIKIIQEHSGVKTCPAWAWHCIVWTFKIFLFTSELASEGRL